MTNGSTDSKDHISPSYICQDFINSLSYISKISFEFWLVNEDLNSIKKSF